MESATPEQVSANLGPVSPNRLEAREPGGSWQALDKGDLAELAVFHGVAAAARLALSLMASPLAARNLYVMVAENRPRQVEVDKVRYALKGRRNADNLAFALGYGSRRADEGPRLDTIRAIVDHGLQLSHGNVLDLMTGVQVKKRQETDPKS